MKTKSLIILGSISYLVFLLALTPAATIVPLLNIPKQTLSASAVAGSLWSGSVQTIRAKQHIFNTSQWSLKPLSLFTGNVSADLTTHYKELPVSTELDYSLLSQHVKLNNLVSSFSAASLQDLLKLPFGQLAGNIRVNLDSVSIIPKKLPQVNGAIDWHNATLILSESMAFGHINIQFVSDGTAGQTATISNKDGELSINGSLKIQSNQSYTLNLRLQPRTNASSELRNLLPLIAPKKVKSEHIILRKGHLRDLGIKF